MARSYKKWRQNALKDGTVREAYEQDDDDPCLQIAHAILSLRKSAKITQAELADKIGTSQQQIARLESLSYHGYTLETLTRVAGAFNKKIKVEFVAA